MKRGWLAKCALVAGVLGGLAWFLAANQTTAAGSLCPIYEGSGFTTATQPPAHLLAAQERMASWLRSEGFAELAGPAEGTVAAPLVHDLQGQAVKGLPGALQVWRGRPRGASTIYVILHQMDLSNPTGGCSRLFEFNAWVVWEYRGLLWPVRRADRAAQAFTDRLHAWWRAQPPLLAPAAEVAPAVGGTAAAAVQPAAAAVSAVSQPRL
jgi:hypothetical protein